MICTAKKTDKVGLTCKQTQKRWKLLCKQTHTHSATSSTQSDHETNFHLSCLVDFLSSLYELDTRPLQFEECVVYYVLSARPTNGCCCQDRFYIDFSFSIICVDLRVFRFFYPCRPATVGEKAISDVVLIWYWTNGWSKNCFRHQYLERWHSFNISQYEAKNVLLWQYKQSASILSSCRWPFISLCSDGQNVFAAAIKAICRVYWCPGGSIDPSMDRPLTIIELSSLVSPRSAITHSYGNWRLTDERTFTGWRQFLNWLLRKNRFQHRGRRDNFFFSSNNDCFLSIFTEVPTYMYVQL